MRDQWREELARLQARIDDETNLIVEAEGVVRRLKKRREDYRKAHAIVYEAFLRGDAELPPRQAEMFDGAEEAGDAPAAWPASDRAELIEDELHAALFPAGRESAWKQFRDAGGISDQAVDVALSGLWPNRRSFRCDSEDGPGHTVRGGADPAFWLGDVASEKVAPTPDLAGRELADAVRRALHLSKFVDDVEPEAPRRHVPPTAADRQPVRAAKGSPRAAGAVR